MSNNAKHVTRYKFLAKEVNIIYTGYSEDQKIKINKIRGGKRLLL